MLIFLLFLLLVGLLINSTYSGQSERLRYFVIGVLSLYWGFSLINAPDIEGYMYCYEIMGTTGNPYKWVVGLPFHHFEPGFMFYMYFLKKIYDSYYFFQFVTYLLELSLTYYGISRLLKDEPISLRILCVFAVQLTLFMAAMRQGFAIALFIFSLPFVIEKKYLKVLLCVFAGIMFHRSIVIVFLIIGLYWAIEKFFPKFEIKVWTAFGIFLLCNAVYFTGFSLSEGFSELSLLFFNEMELAENRDYAAYAESLSGETNFGVLKVLEMDTCYVILFFNKGFKKIRVEGLLVILFLFYFLLNLTAGGILIHRTSYFLFVPYYIVQYLILTYVIRRFLGVSDKIASYFVFAYIVFMFIIQRLMGGQYVFEYHLLDFLS